MIELIEYRNKCSLTYLNNPKPSQFIYFLLSYLPISFPGRDYEFFYFRDAIELFYNEEPDQKPNLNTQIIVNKMNDKMNILDTKIKIIGTKLETLEQFQAQILDKL